MFNAISHQGNGIQNHREIPFYTIRMAKIKTDNKYQQRCEEIPSYSAGGNVKWYHCAEKQFGNSSKG